MAIRGRYKADGVTANCEVINDVTAPWFDTERAARSGAAGWGIPFAVSDPVLSDARKLMRAYCQVAIGNEQCPFDTLDRRETMLLERLDELAAHVPIPPNPAPGSLAARLLAEAERERLAAESSAREEGDRTRRAAELREAVHELLPQFDAARRAIEAATRPVFPLPPNADLAPHAAALTSAMELIAGCIRSHDALPAVARLRGYSQYHWVECGELVPAHPAVERPALIADRLARVDLEPIQAALRDHPVGRIVSVVRVAVEEPFSLARLVSESLPSPFFRRALGQLEHLAYLLGPPDPDGNDGVAFVAEPRECWRIDANPAPALHWLAVGAVPPDERAPFPALAPWLERQGVPFPPDPCADFLERVARTEAVYAGPGGEFARLAADLGAAIALSGLGGGTKPRAAELAERSVREFWERARWIGLAFTPARNPPAEPAHVTTGAEERNALAVLLEWAEREHRGEVATAAGTAAPALEPDAPAGITVERSNEYEPSDGHGAIEDQPSDGPRGPDELWWRGGRLVFLNSQRRYFLLLKACWPAFRLRTSLTRDKINEAHEDDSQLGKKPLQNYARQLNAILDGLPGFPARLRRAGDGLRWEDSPA